MTYDVIKAIIYDSIIKLSKGLLIKIMKKRVFSTELAYVIGITAIALGTAFMTTADLGVSMIVAPAYLLYLKLSQLLPFVTFGVAEYIMQFLVLILMMLLLRKFKVKYLFSFLTAIIYGLLLDFFLFLISFIPAVNLAVQITYFTVGLLIIGFGVALMFNTYLIPEVYDLFVKELCINYGFNVTKCKTIYDISSCLVAVILSFCFFGFGHFEGIKLGTVVCSIVNGFVIGRFCSLLDKLFIFKDSFKKSAIFD